MRKKIIVALPLLIWFATPFHSLAAEKSLRNTLEQSWNNYLKAGRSGKESDLAKSMSSYRFSTMKNNLASAKRSLTPSMIKSISEDAVDISTAKFLAVMEKGATAGLVYGRDSQEKDASGKPRVDFIFIKFVKENEVWKVDGGIEIGKPKFDDNGGESVFDPADLPPTYEIDGRVLESPKPISTPEISGMLDVFSYGYKTEVTINGVEQNTTTNKSYSGLIKGGLHKGKNRIALRFTKAEDKPGGSPRVTIRQVAGDRKIKEIFDYELKKNEEGEIALVFVADE